MNDYDNNERHNTMNDETTLGREYLDGNGARWFASIAYVQGASRRSIYCVLADGTWRSWADRDPALFDVKSLKNNYAEFPADVAVDWGSCGPWGGPCLFKRIPPPPPPRRKVTLEVEYAYDGPSWIEPPAASAVERSIAHGAKRGIEMYGPRVSKVTVGVKEAK